MIDWKEAYRWTRDILAIFGAIGAALFMLIFGLVCAEAYFPHSGMAKPADPQGDLEGAASLLNEAGIVLGKQELTVVGYNPGEWLPTDNSNVELWCVRAPALSLGERWLPARDLEPMFAQAAATTVDALHRAHSCVPTWSDVQTRGMALQPMQLVYSQRELGFARIALYDRDLEMLYLLSRAVPTPSPRPAPDDATAKPAHFD